MHGLSRCMYMLTRKSRFLAGSVLKLMNTQVNILNTCTHDFNLEYKKKTTKNRQRYVLPGSFKTTKRCKTRSPTKRPCSARSTRGCFIASDRAPATSTSNTLRTFRVARRPDSMIHSRSAGHSGRLSCSRCTAR